MTVPEQWGADWPHAASTRVLGVKMKTVEVDDVLMLLQRTPTLLDAWLRGMPDAWSRRNEGPDTWSPFDVVGHLIHGEETDWMARARMILEHGESKTFTPFDRFAQFEASRGKTLEELLDRFAALRRENLGALRKLGLTSADYERRGRHPAFGTVTLGQLLATWAVHDQNHIAQIARVLAKNYRDAVGPWREYLPVVG